MKIKPGVNVTGLRPEMTIALMAAQRIYDDYGVFPVITSALDGRHSRGSLHYAGLAVDLRTRDFRDGDAVKAAPRIKEALGVQYDVILESIGKPNQHIHIEFQPKD